MNKVILIGNVTKDIALTEVKETILAKFSIAVQRKYKKNIADFINIVAFGKTAENCAKFLAKGSKIAISGSIQTGSYEKDGKKVYTTDVIADEVQFLPKGGEQQEPEQVKVTMVDEDLPF